MLVVEQEDLTRLRPGEPSRWRYVYEPLDDLVRDEDLQPYVWGYSRVSFYPWYDHPFRHKVAETGYRWRHGDRVTSDGREWELVSARCVYRASQWCMRWLARPAPEVPSCPA